MSRARAAKERAGRRDVELAAAKLNSRRDLRIGLLLELTPLSAARCKDPSRRVSFVERVG